MVLSRKYGLALRSWTCDSYPSKPAQSVGAVRGLALPVRTTPPAPVSKLGPLVVSARFLGEEPIEVQTAEFIGALWCGDPNR